MKCPHGTTPQETAIRVWFYPFYTHSLDPKEGLTQQARREMNVWYRLRHRNVLPFVGLFTLGPRTYLVSPWMERGNALEYVQRNPDARPKDLLFEIASGIEYLHTFDPVVIHGDLKGANVLISARGIARIADFGLSYDVADDAVGANSTTWYDAGNPRWQAPELLAEKSLRTTATDIFAFGRCCYLLAFPQLYTGEIPFYYIERRDAITALVMKNKLPNRPSGTNVKSKGFDSHMWELVKHCCQGHPEQRPNAEAVVLWLRNTYTLNSDVSPPSLLSRLFCFNLC
ncbi:hypothetical protein BOTBODRAFT_110051 [Botryobasidium botryosum FD-172 SS1]|uniref:Protein kinase domain-containing protein n=1 Tax=Botryobasidium botryosum (strain FD-172 SS1) TaxID=930990 RepID=A0A067MSA6_BOTB1|nr:hypothetical protein BOTBODRAFT_110051 [Botryobasidium botryosum FD-172 SS1]